MSLITLPRSDFLALAQEVLDYRDRAKIPSRLGKLIASADPGENQFHIEPSSIDGPDWCNLWHIKDWRTHVEQMKLKRELSFHEREVAVNITNVRDKLVKRLKACEEFMYLDDDYLQGIADKLVVSRSADAIRYFTRLGISDLLAADQKLAGFKKEKGLES